MSEAAATDSLRPENPILRLEAVTMAFGGLQALIGVDLAVAPAERLAVLGPNGAGKTTLFNVITGDLTPTEGTVEVLGVDCTELPSRLRPRLGVARTYQKTRLFAGLTVSDNLYLAQTGKSGRHLALWRNRGDRRLRDRAAAMAERVWLADDIDTVVGSLSHGQQRQLEIGVALVSDPQLLMLDEPASGLSRGERERLVTLLEGLPEETTVLLIEHDMDVALKTADRVVVLSEGSVVAEGTPSEIRRDPVVHSVYLGEHHHEPAEPEPGPAGPAESEPGLGEGSVDG